MDWNIKVVFDRRHEIQEKGFGKLDIEVYFPSDKQRLFKTTPIKLAANQWDEKQQKVVHHPDAARINAALKRDISRLDELMSGIEDKGRKVTRASVKREMETAKVKKRVEFLEWCREELASRELRYGTNKYHKSLFDAMERFGRLKRWRDLTPENIRAFDRFLHTEDPSRAQTTIYNYHKRLKSYINPAFQLGYIDDNPYNRVHFKCGHSKPRLPLTEDEILAIRKLKIFDRYMDIVRDDFVFMCYTGLSWADLDAFDFKKHAIKSGQLYYIDSERIKTGSSFYTPILAPAMEILKKHNYKLRVPTNQACNRLLKAIAVAAGIEKPLTCHIARHTFATTIILAHDVPIEALARMMGHQNILVTQTYAKVLHSSVERNIERLTDYL